MTWRVNVPARVATVSGWIVLRNGEPPCPIHSGYVRPSRAAARKEAQVLRRGRDPLRLSIVRCALVLGWGR